MASYHLWRIAYQFTHIIHPYAPLKLYADESVSEAMGYGVFLERPRFKEHFGQTFTPGIPCLLRVP